jgi:hypothetical protein
MKTTTDPIPATDDNGLTERFPPGGMLSTEELAAFLAETDESE